VTLRQLEYLVAVAQAGSFTVAATELHVSQPTLSQQIRALEQEVGAALIERLPRGIRLTPAGKAMFGDAQATLASARRALSNTRRAVASEPQMITLATVRSLAAAVLPATVKRWHEVHPEISVSMLEFASRHQVAGAVQDGTADLGIGPLPEDWVGARTELGWEQLILVLPASDPLARTSGDIKLEALANRDWVLYEEGHGLGDQALAACHAAGFEPQCAVQTAQVEVAARLAAAGIGPTLVPIKNVPPDLLQNVRAIDPPVTWRVWAYTILIEFTPTVAAFAEVLIDSPWQRSANALPQPSAQSRPSAASNIGTWAATS
jgi:DNA-binding transcriptional LysR family regulator